MEYEAWSADFADAAEKKFVNRGSLKNLSAGSFIQAG